MIIVLLSYTAPLEVLDQHAPAHMAWLNEAYAAGHLLASGRKVPRTGGMLLVRGDLDAAKAWAATDPFAINGVAEYSFTDVDVRQTAEGLEGLKV